MPRTIVLATVAAVAVALAGLGLARAGGRPVAGGPLEIVESTTFCAPSPSGAGWITWGVVPLTNRTDRPIVVERVSPTDDLEGLIVEDVGLRLVAGRTMVGLSLDWPPAGERLALVEGFEVPAVTEASGTVTAELVGRVRLEDPERDGSFTGVRIVYRHADQRYETVRLTGMRVPAAGQPCL